MRQLSDVILNQSPVVLPYTTSIKSACQQMRDRKVGSVLVTDEHGALIGIFTGRDAVGVLARGRQASRTQLREVMTAKPTSMSSKKTAIEALRLMFDGGFRHVPLVDGDKIVGVVSRGDFKAQEQERLEDEREIWEHMR
jgi:CBS domain-containing protein